MNKTWLPGVNLYALVDREPEGARYEGFGADTDQTITFKVDRFKCEEINVYPEIGDIILYNNAYFEIDNTTEIQYAGGQPYNSFSIVLTAFMVSKSNLNIEERIK